MSAALGWARDGDDRSGPYARFGMLTRDQTGSRPATAAALALSVTSIIAVVAMIKATTTIALSAPEKSLRGLRARPMHASSRESQKPFNDSSLNGAKFPA